MLYHQTYNDHELLQLASDGDEQAFQQIFHHYWPQVYGTALHLSNAPDWAHDLAQDIFLRLWHNRHKLKDVKRLDAYIYILSRNLIMDFLRKKVFDKTNIDLLKEHIENGTLSPLERMESEEREILLYGEIDRLPGKVREVFRLKYVEGMTHQEIAGKLNISVVSSKTYIVRAMRAIRTRLGGLSRLLVLLLYGLSTWL